MTRHSKRVSFKPSSGQGSYTRWGADGSRKAAIREGKRKAALEPYDLSVDRAGNWLPITL